MTPDIKLEDDPMSMDMTSDANNDIKHDHHNDGTGPACSNWNLIKNPSNGRTRISQACDRCRARKIKCSGKSENNPKCTNCEKDGFPCIVSDKLTRNSFPKGYTKNLEKKLLDVELNRNQLLLEIETLKRKISTLELASSNGSNFKIKQTDESDLSSPARSISNNQMTINSEMIHTLSYSHIINNNNKNKGINNDSKKSCKNDSTVHTPTELNLDSIDISRKQAYFNKQIETNTSGLLIIDQNLKSPFETVFASLKSNPFKGYKSDDLNPSLLKMPNGNGNSTSSSVSSGSVCSSQINQNHLSNPQNDAIVLKSLTTYHMNLNRYLNLILYKLIFPLFNQDSKYSTPSVSASGSTSASMRSSSSFSSHTSNNTSDSSKNLDHLIWLFFNDYNKLIPILEFELFYNDYLTFVNTYTLKKSTYLDNGEIKKRYYEFNPKDQDTMIKLILILKFTLCQPKIDENNKSSAFLPDKSALNQLDESIKLINMKHLIMMFRNINFCLSPNLDKLEISLLLFYYLIKFENYNLPNYTDSLHSHKEFLLDVINLNVNLVHTLNIDKPSELLLTNRFQEKKMIEIQRLKLYWNFKILIKLSEIYFNIPFIDEDYDSGSYDLKNMPLSLDSIVLVNNDIQITLCLVKLLKLIPWNIMEFVNYQNSEVLKRIDSKLSEWKKSVEDLYNEENSLVFNKLKSYYLYFKILVNINGKIDSSYFIDFINLVYDLTFNNPKSGNKSHDISIEAAESLCLHSFNFHLITLISITNLQNIKDKVVSQKIYKLIQLYQILISYKDVDPLISTFVTYIKENILYSFVDASTIQDDALKVFSSIDLERSNNGSLFDKKVLNRNKSINYHHHNQQQNQQQQSLNFDLNAFNLPGDSNYSIDDAASSISNKRRKSTASTSSFMSSNVSLASRESSIVSSSRRLSASSNDSMPSLFPSATSPYHNPTNTLNNNLNEFSSTKKRIMDHAIQPLRTTMNRSRSLSADSRMRSIKNDRRLSGSNTLSRENSIDPSSSSIRNSMNHSINNNHPNNDDQIMNSVDDEIISHILNSDVDSELDSDVSMSITGKSNFKSSNFKPNLNLLPTIPSEGNLMKIMGTMETDAIDPMKKLDFDVDSLFSFGNGLSPNVNVSDATTSSFNNNHVSPESNIPKNNMSDFSRAFKKTPSGSISSAFNSPSNTPATIKTNISKSGLTPNDKSLIDDDDLMRLKEHILNMKSSIQ